MPSITSYFNPASSEHHAFSDSKKLSTEKPALITLIWAASIFVGIFTFGFGGLVTFRSLVGSVSTDHPKKQSKKTTEKATNLADQLLTLRKARASDSTATPQSTKQTLDTVVIIAADKYPFLGYSVPGIPNYTHAASYNKVPAIKDGKMTLTKNVIVENIGRVSNCYTWKEKPSLDAIVPTSIKDAAVHLPKNLSASKFNKMRQTAQEGVVSGKGITPETAQRLALALRGVVIEASMPYKAGALLQDRKPDVVVHCIFQTGLNFAGSGGGGIPLSNTESAVREINNFSEDNAEAALTSAIRNKSDVLVFNLGIGTGFFGGQQRDSVKQANVEGICKAMESARKKNAMVEVIVPNVRLTPSQMKQLKDAGIRIVSADKDAVAALCARKGLRVSETVAGDPMSMLGIHGPGFWWETAGSASDEERAAFLSPSYALGHIPINLCEFEKPAQKIAALSEFMLK